ncbi:ATP-binding protein [Streptomyces sp. NPDC093221]|uniref:ATP-binding protein n=1 Tax=Streptomyces sp. NPDC093221 TaxID=3366032 RepID=UPI003809F7A3
MRKGAHPMNDVTADPHGSDTSPEPNGTMTLYPVPESVGRARRWFRHFVEPHGLACSVDDCVLMISELVTNAVLYGESEDAWRVRIEWWRERTDLRVEVHNPGSPFKVQLLKRPAILEDSEHGRGLWLVDALSDSWQVRPSQYGGTAVSFTMADAWPSEGAAVTEPRSSASPGAVGEPDTCAGRRPAPWTAPGTWTIATEGGAVVSGYLPEWAEDDPTEVGVPPDLLPSLLAQINHRSLFEGPMLPLAAPDVWDGVEEDAVFEGSIDCDPYDEDPRLRMPVVNLHVAVGRWIPALDPQGLAEVTAKLRAHADFLDTKVRPALIAAREDWAAHHPD